MPVYPGIKYISISHPILGKGVLPGKIGDMSVELAIWLKAKRELQYGQEYGDRSLIVEYANILHDQQKREWYTRCRYAATKAFPRPYADASGDLTDLGYEIATYILQQFDTYEKELEAHDEYLDSNKWTKADQVILNGSITRRQAKMLRLLYSALRDAERRNLTEIEEKFNVARSRIIADADPRVVTPFDAESALTEEIQDFQAIMVEADIDGIGSKTRQAYVPTSIFGQIARNDLKNLIRFGLVNLSAMLGTGRGRPKHVVRISAPGQVVLDDLIDRGLA